MKNLIFFKNWLGSLGSKIFGNLGGEVLRVALSRTAYKRRGNLYTQKLTVTSVDGKLD